MKQLKFAEQKKKQNLRILSKAHPYLQSDISLYRCFIKNCIKLLGVFTHKRYYLYNIVIDKITSTEGRKILSEHPGKSDLHLI